MELENSRKPKKKRKRKLPRILVEWFCGKCNEVHRLSFPYSLKPLIEKRKGIRVKWGKAKLKIIEFRHETTLTEMNNFLVSLFSQEFDAKEYVKIWYPRKLFNLLRKNERGSKRHS